MASSAVFNVSDFLDRQRFGRSHAVVLTLCALITFMDGYDIYVVAYILLALTGAFHVPPAAIAPALVLQQVGLALGCYLIAPLADRFGRKAVTTWSVAGFAVLSLATTQAHSVTEFGALRFLSGLFFGGALPNAMALINEVAPKPHRAIMTTTLSAGISLSAAIGAGISIALVKAHGWQSVFVVGGLAPIALLPFLFVLLPESLRFRVARNERDPRIGAALKRLDPALQLSGSERFVINEVEERRMPVVALLKEGRAATTLLLWIGFFMSGFLLTVYGQFLPTFLHLSGGLSPNAAIALTGFYAFAGTILQVLIGVAGDRAGVRPVLIAAFVGGGLTMAAFGYTDVHSGIVYVMLFLLALTVQATGGLLSTLCAWSYPTSMRATGLGWGWGLSRTGAICAPVVGGAILAARHSLPSIFLTISIATWLGALAMVLIRPVGVDETTAAEPFSVGAR